MAYKTVKIKARGDACIEEYYANAAFKPGHVLYLLSTGRIAKHATAGGALPVIIIAMENQLCGKTIDDEYAAGEQAQVWLPGAGDEFYGLLLNGESVHIGDKLESGGDGTLREVDADTSAGTIALDSVVGIAMEAVDMSGSSGADPSGRIRVKVRT